MPKMLTFNQILELKYRPLEFLAEPVLNSFGRLTNPFQALIWGNSGNGKTNLVMQLIRTLSQNGPVLFVSLEEGHEVTLQNTLNRHLAGCELPHGLRIADAGMNYEELQKTLRRRRSAHYIIIDSIQYLNIDKEQYKSLKEEFRRKSFLFISHAQGKLPKGSVACDVMYDAGVKVRVEGYIAFPQSRYGGNEPYLIWEEGARRYWGKQFKKIIQPKKA